MIKTLKKTHLVTSSTSTKNLWRFTSINWVNNSAVGMWASGCYDVLALWCKFWFISVRSYKWKKLKHEFHETCLSVTFYMYFMKKDTKWCCDTTTPESIHTKDESKRGSIPVAAIRWKFHPGHKCQSPHYHGRCLSIRPYLGESDVKLSHPSIHHYWAPVLISTPPSWNIGNQQKQRIIHRH